MRLIPALLSVSFCFAQQPPSFKAEVGLVNVAFAARDSRGDLVADLTRDDVEVFEDDIAQRISFFARSAEVPLTLGLVVDVSGSQEHFFKQHDRDAKEFFRDVLRPQDRAFVMSFGNFLRLLSDYSADGDRLLDGLKRFEHGDRSFPLIGPPEQRVLGTAFYDAIYYAATEKLPQEVQGRKALIVFSDGEDNSSAHHMLDAIEGAQAANAVLFAIRYTETKSNRPNARNKYGMRVMERVARETGGTDFDTEKGDMRSFFRQIGDELRSSYELAYHTTQAAHDGSFRKIAIRVKRPGITVRCKTGYFAR